MDADALYKELDQEGPYLKTAIGTLEKTSFIRIKKVIARRTYLTFVKRRDELLDQRVLAITEYANKGFRALVEQGDLEFTALLGHINTLSYKYIDMDKESFKLSHKELMAVPEVRAQVY